MSSRRGTRQSNDLAILIGLLVAIGAVVMLALPSEGSDAEVAPPPEQTITY